MGKEALDPLHTAYVPDTFRFLDWCCLSWLSSGKRDSIYEYLGKTSKIFHVLFELEMNIVPRNNILSQCSCDFFWVIYLSKSQASITFIHSSWVIVSARAFRFFIISLSVLTHLFNCVHDICLSFAKSVYRVLFPLTNSWEMSLLLCSSPLVTENWCDTIFYLLVK
jgi:hypothetical protein